MKEEHQKCLIEYTQARSDMAQAENEIDAFIASIDRTRNELQKWKEHGGTIDVSHLPSPPELAKALTAFNTAKAAADRAAKNLPDTIRKLFQTV